MAQDSFVAELQIALDLRQIVVVAAFEQELQPLRELLREALAEVKMRAVGIGMVDAALGTARVIADEAPALVVLIGTCGAFAETDRDAIIVAREARLVDVAAVSDETALPEVVVSRVALAETFGVARELGLVATTLGITIDDEIATKIAAKYDARAEHMEAFAVARACEERGVRCAIVLGVANRVGKNGRAEWRANHRDASARVASFVASALGRLAKTSPKAPSRA